MLNNLIFGNCWAYFAATYWVVWTEIMFCLVPAPMVNKGNLNNSRAKLRLPSLSTVLSTIATDKQAKIKLMDR